MLACPSCRERLRHHFGLRGRTTPTAGPVALSQRGGGRIDDRCLCESLSYGTLSEGVPNTATLFFFIQRTQLLLSLAIGYSLLGIGYSVPSAQCYSFHGTLTVPTGLPRPARSPAFSIANIQGRSAYRPFLFLAVSTLVNRRNLHATDNFSASVRRHEMKSRATSEPPASNSEFPTSESR